MPAKKKPRKPMSDEARAAASERMRQLNLTKRESRIDRHDETKRAKADGWKEGSTYVPFAEDDDLVYEGVAAEITDKRREHRTWPEQPAHECQWLPGDYKAHDGNGWRLAQVYCPIGKHWESVDA